MQPEWMAEILDVRSRDYESLATEWAFRPPRPRMKIDRLGVPAANGNLYEPMVEWDSRQSVLWAATFNTLAGLCDASRKALAWALGHNGMPSGPFRVRQFW